MKPIRQTAVLFALLFTGCFGAGTLELSTETPAAIPGDDYTPLPAEEPLPVPPEEDLRMVGAGGRDLRNSWDPIDVPLSANAKLLAFDMMKSEVERATGLSWVVAGADQWERNRAAFGGPNYTTAFAVDITPSPQKISLWRKMAYQVCADAVARDAAKATRVLFTDVDPALPISTSNAAVNAQISGLYQRFFLEEPTPQAVTLATNLLAAAFADGNDPREAWRALCVGYLASMKFLTY